MKFAFQKVLYDELDIDFQKIYDSVIRNVSTEDGWDIYNEYWKNEKHYLSTTHDMDALFDSYDLVFLNSDFSDNESVLSRIRDYFFDWLRDKYGI